MGLPQNRLSARPANPPEVFPNKGNRKTGRFGVADSEWAAGLLFGPGGVEELAATRGVKDRR
jgi:hypothetical protein